jgi:hypothetical protein
VRGCYQGVGYITFFVFTFPSYAEYPSHSDKPRIAKYCPDFGYTHAVMME